MRSLTKKLSAVTALTMASALALAGCGSSVSAGDSDSRDESYTSLQASQPAETMQYSPTRETINFWVETWDEPGKLSYVYLRNIDGDITGYYVLEGLPVSMCAQISPNYDIGGDSSSRVVVPAPANDGAYYGGADCQRYYGKDASTGAYIEYTAGMGNNPLLFSEPMPHVNHQDLNALGETEVGDE